MHTRTYRRAGCARSGGVHERSVSRLDYVTDSSAYFGETLPLTPVDNEGVGSNVQTHTAPELVFRALLAQDGAQRLVFARPQRSDSHTSALWRIAIRQRYVCR